MQPAGEVNESGGRVFIGKKRGPWVWFLPVVLLFAMTAWVQVTAGDDAYRLTSAFNPARSLAVKDVAVHDHVAGQDLALGAITKDVATVGADLSSVDNTFPATLTVRTAALLELHAMRKSAVDLCVQLPTKYRTRQPQCADIFKHEIRLQALAKHRQ
jgi:hypothetical protein